MGRKESIEHTKATTHLPFTVASMNEQGRKGQNYRAFYAVNLTLNGKNYQVGDPSAGNLALGRNGKGASSGSGRHR